MAKLKEMNEEVATELNPNSPKEARTRFLNSPCLAITIYHKRGSGVRGLVLLNFLKQKVERKQKEIISPNVIYAIEEPETSLLQSGKLH